MKSIGVRIDKLKRRKLFLKILRIVLLVLTLILLISYVVMRIIYNNGNFSITLDKNLYFEKGLIIYDDPEYKVFRQELYAGSIEYFDNISYKWLPKNLDQGKGSHNGKNYLAYTFYIENTGTDVTDYYYEIIIDDVIKNVDEAVRVRLYKNGVETTYAKLGANGKAEKNTTPFESDEVIALVHNEDFAPTAIDRYTVVMWLEGSDPDCTDNILGGEIKIHMDFNSEITEPGVKQEEE